MSVVETQGIQMQPRLQAERLRAIQRSRRAEEGSVSEMARLLLREARELRT